MSEETQRQLIGLRHFRDQIQQEVMSRMVTGKKQSKDFYDLSDAELSIYNNWYCNKIDSILAPYEKEES